MAEQSLSTTGAGGERTAAVRYFQDPNKVTWRVHPTGMVQRWSPDAARWTDSDYERSGLENDSEISEVTEPQALTVIPLVPSDAVAAEIRIMWRAGRTMSAVERAVEASRLSREDAQQWVDNMMAGQTRARYDRNTADVFRLVDLFGGRAS